MNENEQQLSAVADQKKLLGQRAFSLTPTTLDEAMKYSEMIAKSSIVPPQFKDKPADVLVAIQLGLEIGAKPLQALQGIAVINGRPTVFGDLALAIVQGSGLVEYIREYDDGHIATCEIKRRDNAEPIIRTFSVDDAKTAGLLNKQGPWAQYPKRMRQMRARSFALRDGFSDALKGMSVREEIGDYQEIGRVDEHTTVVMPTRRSQQAKPVTTNDVPVSVSNVGKQEQPQQKTAGDDPSIITRVTKSGDKFYVYVGNVKFWTDNKDMADYAKKLHDRKASAEISHEAEQDGFRKIVEIRELQTVER